jgi:hypothetical protein
MTIRFGKPPHGGRDPGRNITKVFQQLLFIVVAQPLPKHTDKILIDIPPAEVTQGLDHQTAYPAGRGHVTRGGSFEEDLLLSQLHPPGRTIREENNLHGHLIGKPEKIGGVSAGWLQACCIPAGQGAGDGVHGRGQQAEMGVTPGVIIKTTRQTADCSFPAEPGKRHAYGTGIADTGEKFWCEDDTPSSSIHHGNHFFINGLHDNKLDILLKKLYTIFNRKQVFSYPPKLRG